MLFARAAVVRSSRVPSAARAFSATDLGEDVKNTDWTQVRTGYRYAHVPEDVDEALFSITPDRLAKLQQERGFPFDKTFKNEGQDFDSSLRFDPEAQVLPEQEGPLRTLGLKPILLGTLAAAVTYEALPHGDPTFLAQTVVMQGFVWPIISVAMMSSHYNNVVKPKFESERALYEELVELRDAIKGKIDYCKNLQKMTDAMRSVFDYRRHLHDAVYVKSLFDEKAKAHSDAVKQLERVASAEAYVREGMGSMALRFVDEHLESSLADEQFVLDYASSLLERDFDCSTLDSDTVLQQVDAAFDSELPAAMSKMVDQALPTELQRVLGFSNASTFKETGLFGDLSDEEAARLTVTDEERLARLAETRIAAAAAKYM
ncbi:MAG: hypothetical protein MHM6MM_006281 [Cercozoa sp. M6MM]